MGGISATRTKAARSQQHSRERLPKDLGAEPLLAVRQRLQELRHELGQVQQRRASAGQNALLQEYCSCHTFPDQDHSYKVVCWCELLHILTGISKSIRSFLSQHNLSCRAAET